MGSNTSYTVTISPLAGFSGTVGFSVSGLPAGATAAFNPTTVTTSGSSSMTVTVVAGTSTGSYPLTITATSGTLSHTANVTLNITSPDFSVSATPPTQTVAVGSNTSYTVTVSPLAGFSGTVGFSVSGLPAGATAAFNPTTVTTSGSSSMTVTVVAGTSTGSYPLTITATSGTLSHTANVTLNITPPGSSGFLSGSLASPPASLQLSTEGSLDWAHWGLNTSSDFNHKSGVTQQISNFTTVGAGSPLRYNNNPTAFSWTDGTPTLSASNSPTGLYLSGQNNGFRITLPADTSVRTLRLYVGVWRTQGRILAQLSDGSAADFTDTSLVNSAGSTTLGVYTFNYSAASSGQTFTVTFTQLTATSGNVTLQAATLASVTPDFSVSATPPTQTVAVGSNTSYTVTVSPLAGFSGTVGFSVSGLPAGATAAFNPTTVTTSGSSSMTVTVAAGTSTGSYPLTITATSGTLSHTANVTLVVTSPDFSVSATPPTQTVAVGSNTSYTVTVSPLAGFSGTVGFSVSGLPAGATAAFNPTTVTTSGSSSMTVTVAAGTSTGSYPLTITATSGTLSHTANVTLVVTSPDFSVSATPPTQTVAVGSNTSYTVTISPLAGFSGTVGFSVSGLPAGATAAFNPTTVTTSGSSSMTVTVAAGTSTGSYPLTITATSGTLSHTANVTLVVTSPDFSVSATPPTQTVAMGSNTSYTVTISPLAGFSGTVGFSVSGLPAGATAAFNPTTVTTSGSSSMTVTVAAGTSTGSYPLTITATSGTLSHTANVTLVVTSPDFSVSATPPTQTVAVGSNTSYTVTISPLAGFSGTVGFSVSGLPAGATAAFNPTTVTTSGSSSMTVTVAAGTSTGSYPLTITATSGTLSHTANVTLNITPPGSSGFLSGSLASPPASLQLSTEGSLDWAHWGLNTSSDFNHKSGVTQQISNFTTVGAGSPLRYNNNPTAFSWTDGTPTLSASNSPTGLYLSGQNNGFRITLPADTSVRTLRLYVGVWRTQGRILAQLSDGSAADFTDTSLVNSAGSTTLGVYTFNYSAASSGQTFTVTFTQLTATSGNVTLQAATLASVTPDFSVSATPPTQTVAVGSNTSYTVTVSPLAGFSGTVGFSVSGLPAGATAAFNPTTVTTSGSSSMTVTVAAGTSTGSYPLTITATSGTLSHTANVTLVVTSPDFSVSATPPTQTVAVGSNTSYTVTVSPLAGFSGTVGFSVSGLPAGATAAFNPTTVTTSGSSSMTVTVAAGTSTGSYPLTITATSGTLSHTANVTLNITPPGSSGLLSGSLASPPASLQLSTEGSLDWAHWGLNTSSDFNHKSGVPQQISNFTTVGAGSPLRYNNNPTAFSWTDGTPTLSASNSPTGVYISGANSGFRITLPADATVRTLRLYVGVWRTQGRILAQLSDGSAADFTDTSLINTTGNTTLGVYTLTFHAASSGQTLTVTFTQSNPSSGNATLQAASLAP